MKKPAKCFIASIPLLLAAIPQPAKALPFRNNCASMQSYANSLKWSTSTKFMGFENVQPDINMNDWMICSNGFVQETSPMGTRICRAVMSYSTILRVGAGAGFHWSALNGKSSSCRWK